jgi:hypothetical protein
VGDRRLFVFDVIFIWGMFGVFGIWWILVIGDVYILVGDGGVFVCFWFFWVIGRWMLVLFFVFI